MRTSLLHTETVWSSEPVKLGVFGNGNPLGIFTLYTCCCSKNLCINCGSICLLLVGNAPSIPLNLSNAKHQNEYNQVCSLLNGDGDAYSECNILLHRYSQIPYKKVLYTCLQCQHHLK